MRAERQRLERAFVRIADVDDVIPLGRGHRQRQRDFQFRGSLYLYAGHMHFLVFALAAGLAAQVRGQPVGSRIYVGVTLGLAVLVGTTNLGRAVWFVTAFDHVAPDCAPRCGPL